MADSEDVLALQDQADHRPAFIFNPLDEDGPGRRQGGVRPSKRRRVTKKGASAPDTAPKQSGSQFVPLFDGEESAECVALREDLFTSAWSAIQSRIQHVLREVNRKTLDEVGSFVRGAPEGPHDLIPAAFIITGPNITSQELLFDQLAESLADSTPAKVVSVRSAEAPNLKAALKKIIGDATSREYDGDDDADVALGQGGRKYLNYDLEALHDFVKSSSSRRVVVAFQDTEAFDGALLSDLLLLFSSWRDRIRFTLLFGIATSVELFQARLLKSTAQLIHGSQFDVVQANTVLENVFKVAIASKDVALRLGPGLLHTLVERQREQVAGIQILISSVKYAYMCHFYANPLSFVLADDKETLKKHLSTDHLTAIRTLASFRAQVEGAVDARQLNYAALLLDDDSFLSRAVFDSGPQRNDYSTELLRSLHLIQATGIPVGGFTDLYIAALSEGIDLTSEGWSLLDSVRRLPAEDIVSLIRRLSHAVKEGAPELGLPGWAEEAEGELVACLDELLDEVDSLAVGAKHDGKPLRSKYSAQSKVLRTTVVAQKVQLSQDTAELTPEDKAFTEAIDRLVELLTRTISCESINSTFLNEIWVYDSKSPYKDVFIPRTGTTVERALSRPHDYLACSCCGNPGGGGGGGGGDGGGVSPTLPSTCILYQLYLEAGALINVADLWSAFYALIGEESETGLGEREALVRFYQGLAELKALGFVKQSKKKADHIAKLKWL